MTPYLLIPAAYLIGSIPFGLLIGKRVGVDLRASGSKNIGATNVLRTAGKIPALLTLLGDSAKGAAAVLAYRLIIDIGMAEAEAWEGIIGLAAVLGHMFPIFLSFKGGKGFATGLGVIAVYSPAHVIAVLIVWLSVAALTRFSSLAAICSIVSLPCVYMLSGVSSTKLFFGILLAILIVLRHKENIRRLVNGTETRIGKKIS